MLVLNLPFKALMFLTLMRPSLVLFLVLWLKLVKDFLKVRCRLALLPFLISCLIWLDLVASLPLIKERILVIILLLHFLSLMLGSVLVLMLPLLVWLTPDLRIKKSLLKCNWTIRKRLPRCKMRLKKRLLAFSRRLHARIRKTRYMHKMRCLLINRRSLLLALRLLWKTPILDRKSGSAGMPRPISYAVFCLKKKRGVNHHVVSTLTFIRHRSPDFRPPVALIVAQTRFTRAGSQAHLAGDIHIGFSNVAAHRSLLQQAGWGTKRSGCPFGKGHPANRERDAGRFHYYPLGRHEPAGDSPTQLDGDGEKRC